MAERRWSLTVLPETLAVARLAPDAPLPDWATQEADSGSAEEASLFPSEGGRGIGYRAGGKGKGGEPINSVLSVTRTPSELSIVCAAGRVPAGVTAVRDWRALVVAGPLDFSEIGVLASLTGPLAGVGVSVFALSTYDTDYLLVREAALEEAVAALHEAGHAIDL